MVAVVYDSIGIAYNHQNSDPLSSNLIPLINRHPIHERVVYPQETHIKNGIKTKEGISYFIR
jgi:hypothetical protein